MEMIKRYTTSALELRGQDAESKMKIARSIVNQAMIQYYKDFGAARVAEEIFSGLSEAILIYHVLVVFDNRWESCKIRWIHETSDDTITGVVNDIHLDPDYKGQLPRFVMKGGNQVSYIDLGKYCEY